MSRAAYGSLLSKYAGRSDAPRTAQQATAEALEMGVQDDADANVARTGAFGAAEEEGDACDSDADLELDIEDQELDEAAEEAAELDANGYDASDDFLAPDDDAEAVAPEPVDAPEPAAAAGMGAGVGGAQGSRRSKRRRKRRVLADE